MGLSLGERVTGWVIELCAWVTGWVNGLGVGLTGYGLAERVVLTGYGLAERVVLTLSGIQVGGWGRRGGLRAGLTVYNAAKPDSGSTTSLQRTFVRVLDWSVWWLPCMPCSV